MSNQLSRNQKSDYQPTRPPWVRIVIVAYNSSAHLQSCIDALYNQAFDAFEVTIVDNNCPQQSTAQLALPDSRFRVIKSDRNLGFAGGTNLGAQGANSEWIISLNPDTRASSDWLMSLFLASQSNPEFDMLGTTLLQADKPHLVDGFGDVLSIYGLCWRGGSGYTESSLPSEDLEVFGACGAAACYRRIVFESLSGFDEAYFCYLEDVDLAFRFQINNRKCLQVRNAVVLHVGGASSEGAGDFSVYQTYRNNLRLLLVNARPLMLLPMLFLHLGAQTYTVLRNRKSPDTKARLRGLCAGLKTIPAAFRHRKLVQSYGTVNSWTISKKLAWQPSGLKLRRIVKFKPTQMSTSPKN